MKSRILVVDDEKVLRNTFEYFFSEEGYEVSLASSYHEAVEKINKNRLHIIFADILLGEKTGIELLSFVKEKKKYIPVIMITGYPSLETASEAVRLGAFDYISKPVKRDKLLHLARKALDYKEAVDEKERYRKNLEAIFKSVEEGIITVDCDLRIIEINDAAKNICDFSGDVKGKHIKNIFKFYNMENCIDIVKKTLGTGRASNLSRIEGRGKAGERIISLKVTPLIEEEKKMIGSVIVIRDETELQEITKQLQDKGRFHNIIGKNSKMNEIYSLLEKLSNVETTVLVRGESGTGKELIADAIHYKGNRKKKPLIKVNCSALPENLLESELFGHVKGSFTGAVKDKIGWFQRADKGTIFLDEIGDISHSLQLRLLRVLQNKEFVRVGESKPRKIDVRVIASTNQALEEKIEEGTFREDLYYRLKVIEIVLPPLRERAEDIPLLVEHFIKKFNKKFNKNIKGISKSVAKIFMSYSWPGNIRELEHTLEHAFVISNQIIISVKDLPEVLRKMPAGKVSVTYKMSNEEKLMRDALEECNWKKAKVARLLGIDRKTVYRKMKKYDIPIKKP